MALDKNNVTISFVKGLDRKTDPNQIEVDNFSNLSNSVFDTIGRLTKRNGFGTLSSLSLTQHLATFSGNLIGVGDNLSAYIAGANAWTNTGVFQPVSVSAFNFVQNNLIQSQMDVAVSPNGLMAMTYQEGVGFAPSNYYSVTDYTTGQMTLIPSATVSSGSFTQNFPARVYYLNGKFVVLYDQTSTAVGDPISYLAYFTINPSDLSVSSTSYMSSSRYSFTSYGSFDGAVASSTLYVAWNDGFGGSTYVATISSSFQASAAVGVCSFSGRAVTCAFDQGSFFVGVVASASPQRTINYFSTDSSLVLNRTPQTVTSSGTSILSTRVINNITSYAQNGTWYVLSEVQNYYNYPTYTTVPSMGSASCNYVNCLTVASGALASEVTSLKGLGLASKAFVFSGRPYVLTAYQGLYQNAYFLVGTANGAVAKLAYGNGNGYTSGILPSVGLVGSSGLTAYLYQNSIQSVNKGTALSSTAPTAGIYTTSGVRVGKFTFAYDLITPTEIGRTLNLNAGFLWSYDGVKLTENNFLTYPDQVSVIGSGNYGSMTNQTYYYQCIYEWKDNQGNTHRSAPSVPMGLTVASGTSVVSLVSPLPKLTYKTGLGAPSISWFRWSTGQQTYYRVFPGVSINGVQGNGLGQVDTKSDSQIVGNEILYTNGGEVQNVNGPASNAMATWDSRLWAIDAEDPNNLWYSKQVINGTPVEMSDLFTLFIEPNAGAQGPTGPMRALQPMDDKLIIFKRNAIYYISGTGPDVAGNNSQYGEPIFVSSAVGTENPSSVVLIPQGVMFQSDKGIWLLGRDLSTQYIGKDVESYNGVRVLSSVQVPGTNQVRFDLANGVKLMFDYFAGQWGTFTNVESIDSVIYKNRHTTISSSGVIAQETPQVFLDGSTPTTMGFTTAWIDMAGLEGFQRVYKAYLLGSFSSYHTFTIGVAYDYNPEIKQSVFVQPRNVVGSGSQVEQVQINFAQQQCQSIQLTFTETSSQSAGAGLSLSGMNIVYGSKKSHPMNIGVKNRFG